MSFSRVFAGPASEFVVDAERVVAESPSEVRDSFSYGGELGRLTREYLTNVARIAGERAVFIEANGHAVDNAAPGTEVVSLVIRVTARQ